MKVSNIDCELKHCISTMVICGSHMHNFSVSKDMKQKMINDKRRRDVVVGKVVAHLYLTLIIKELKFSVEHDRVLTTLNIIFSVAFLNQSIGHLYHDLTYDEDPHLHCFKPTQHS